MRFLTYFLSLLLFTGQLYAQSGLIKGKMVDAQTREALPFGNVFINNTTIGTATDGDGNFVLKNVQYGQSELVFSYVGYKQSVRRVVIEREVIDLGLVYVNPLEQQLDEVQVKGTRDKEWEKTLKEFEKIFLGDDDMAESCRIINPWVIDFKTDGAGTLMASASAPIEISNSALGYKITFYLNNYLSNPKGYIIRGQVRFEEMLTGDGNQAFLWKANRQNAYLGSSRHLFKSILDGKIRKEGFSLYTQKPGATNAMVRSPYFNAELNQTVIPYDTTSLVLPPPKESGRYLIALKGLVEVHYQGDRAIIRTYRDVAYPVSWLEVNGNYVAVNRDGNPFNPSDVIISGAMNADRVAHMLPLNYEPASVVLKRKEPDKKIVSRLQEKVYLHTDKPYYYPGEVIWFKSYMNYAEPTLRDSLSRVLYVELINPERKIVGSKMLQLSDGSSQGEFIIPTHVEAGDYYLRAYTNWMRNFGDENFFLKQIPILKLNDKVSPTNEQAAPIANEMLFIKSDKEVYAKREKITLNLKVRDDMGKPTASKLSISVTDMRQVVPIVESTSIMQDYPFKDSKTNLTFNFNYIVEDGIGFKGKFLNDAGKPERAALTLIEWKSQEMILTESDKEGIFTLTGLQFYDSAEFSFHAKASKILSDNVGFDYGKIDPKNKPYGRIEVQERNIPTLSFKGQTYELQLENAGSPQRLISDYNDGSATMLKGIDVRDRKLEESKTKTLGGADYVLNAKDFSSAKATNNLWLALAGKIPGLIMTANEVRFARSSGLSKSASPGQGSFSLGDSDEVFQQSTSEQIGVSSQPLILINNMPASGNAIDVLQRIDASTVERVEVSSSVNVLYGTQGANGVISIYTIEGVTEVPGNSKRSKSLQLISIQGYSKPSQFFGPNYELSNTIDRADYRSTLYWNPELTTPYETGETSVTFFAADLETTYRVVVEGVTEFNDPIRNEYLITVQNPR